ncbi:hypothetical protein J0A68_10405 [Algoriphagus sp. H41]|uniref:HEAT repeat domain-containing protein n=1 Tax=Algoriphagus oliviformis TaxID=2811231 RepID=A0ABS3C2M7_9BACT|nr:hypothetical protein [Algoriphagus oliviformis]MBN7811370.1 hypothetical protein [Algoriphagus oliviformis]
MNRLLLLLLFLASPIFCGEVLAQNTSVTARSSGSNTSKWTVNDNRQKSSLETNGKITISEDEKSIASISPGGYLKIERTTFGNSRSLFITNKGGSLDYEYKEGGRSKPFEPDGRIWLSEILPDLLNSTTIGAEARVDRYYAKGGAKSVLGLMSQLKSDHVKSAYLGILMKKNLSQSETSAVIDAVPSQLDSDHYKLEVYKKVPPAYFKDINQLTRAVSNIDSDHFKTELLKPIFKTNVLAGQGEKALQLINLVDSDHFKLEIAKSIPFQNISTQDLRFLVESVVPKIDSDHFKNELLKSVINTNNLTEERALIILNGVKSMDSDHFKAETLKSLCAKQPSERVKQQIREVAKTSIESSHFLGEVMRCAA